MKRLILLIVTTIAFFGLSAQNSTHKTSIGGGIVATDFSAPLTKNYVDFTEMKGTGHVYLSGYLNKSFNLTADFSFGRVFIPQDPTKPNVTLGIQQIDDLYDLGLMLNYKLDNGYILAEETAVGPYLVAGIGGNYLHDDFNTYVPLGFGFNIRPHKRVNLQLQSLYKLNIDNSSSYLQHSASIGFNLGKGKPKVVDSDGDGIADEEDQCPFMAGDFGDFGCPDSDEDGTIDKNDDCPEVAGPKSNKGCPFSDRDNDGVFDKDDRCPDLAGTKPTKGCPDRDGDRIADRDDNCPDEYGTLANDGCPEVVTPTPVAPKMIKSYSIYYDGNSSEITASQRAVLDEAIAMAQQNNASRIEVKGHTCFVGEEVKNMDLSMKRAEKVFSYIYGKGIDGEKINVFGFGEYAPKYSNSVPAEAMKNRRVDIEIYR